MVSIICVSSFTFSDSSLRPPKLDTSMATQAISWGEDAHRSVIELLSWPDNSRLACCNRAFYNAKITCTTANRRASWGQAQSISRDVEDLVASLVGAAQVSPHFAHGKIFC